MKRCQLNYRAEFFYHFITELEQFNIYHDVVLITNFLLLVSLRTLASFYKEQVRIGALNIEFFDAVKQA